MPKLSAKEVRDFVVPPSDLTPSTNGSQREDAIISLYLAPFGWAREASAAAKAAFLPGVDAVGEGNGRGRGATGVDIFRVNPSRAAGGDFGGLKCPAVRADGTVATSVELFHGTKETGAALARAVVNNHRSRKAFPVAVVHTTGGDRFAPVIMEWCVRDFGYMVAQVENREAWPTWCGVPVKPVNDRKRGAGGSPASVWVQFERREYLGNGKARYVPDPDGNYVRINASFSKRSGAVFRTGTPAQFAADLDAATVLR